MFQTAVSYFFHPISFIGFIVHDKQRKMSAKLDYVTTLRPEILEQAEKELGEDEHLRTESVLAIREWVKKQPHLKAMPTGMFFFSFIKLYGTLMHFRLPGRSAIPIEIFTWLQVQHGKDEKETGNDFDHAHPFAGVLQWMGSHVTRNSRSSKRGV